MSYERPTLTGIDQRVRADIEATMDAVPIVRTGSVLAALARGLAGASHALHGHLDWLFRQLFPDTADAAQLERMAGFHGISRGAPGFATGSIRITGSDGAVLPAGAEIGHESGAQFATTAQAVIAGGVATAPVRAAQDGAAANLGAGAELRLLSPVAGIANTAEAVAAFGGGAETESDARLLERLLLKLRRPPHGGAAHDYVAWALDEPGVARVWVAGAEQGPGTVTVRFTVDAASGGPIPSPAQVAAVAARIDPLRPVTAEVFVAAPIPLPVDVTLSVTPDTAAVRAEVENGIADLFAREGAPGERIYLSRLREAVSLAAGEIDNTVAAPVADVVPGAGELPVLGTLTFT